MLHAIRRLRAGLLALVLATVALPALAELDRPRDARLHVVRDPRRFAEQREVDDLLLLLERQQNHLLRITMRWTGIFICVFHWNFR